jgi:hypothetical protein
VNDGFVIVHGLLDVGADEYDLAHTIALHECDCRRLRGGRQTGASA